MAYKERSIGFKKIAWHSVEGVSSDSLAQLMEQELNKKEYAGGI